MLKKPIAAVLCLLLLLGCFTAGVNAATLPGDVNLDGEITAADARLALRAAVMLETLSEEQLLLADVNLDGSVTAADARIILRVAVRLMRLNEAGTEYEDVPVTPAPEPPAQEKSAPEKLRAFLQANATDEMNGIRYYGYMANGIEAYFLLDTAPAENYPFGVNTFYEDDSLIYDAAVWFNEAFTDYVLEFNVYDHSDNLYVSALYKINSSQLSVNTVGTALSETAYDGAPEARADVKGIAGNMAVIGLAYLVFDLQDANAGIDYAADMHMPRLLEK